jgi:uncharacterized membrane protein
VKTFTSSISHKEYPVSESVSGRYLPKYIADAVKKEHPDFSEDSFLAVEELNKYRYQYIQHSMSDESGKISELEKKVLDAMQRNETIASDDDNTSLTYGQKLADKVATFGGSWRFIIIFMSFLVIWMLINIVLLAAKAFDPYPFILLNLILSCIAALQAPVIMMSQNRQEEKDRQRAKNDYMINLKSELEIRMLHEKVDHLMLNQQQRLLEIQQIQIDMLKDIIQHIDKK